MRWSPRCLEIELGSLLSSSIFCMNDGSISSGAVCEAEGEGEEEGEAEGEGEEEEEGEV